MRRDRSTIVIVRLHDAATADAIRGLLTTCGVDPRPGAAWRKHGDRLLVIRPPEPRDGLVEHLEGRPEVAGVVLLAGTRLFEKWPHGGDGRVALSPGAVLGAERPVVIAGPCSVESEAQMLDTATMVADSGAQALRGGVFKPRTSPYEFGGLEREGLDYLVKARELTGLPFVTEALDPDQLDVVASIADMIQIGARNMHNSPLLFRAGSHSSGRPILLKRGFAATIDEFLNAAEYVLLGRLAAGHPHPGLVLCERGIRSFETETRFTLDVAAIPVLAQRTYLPCIADPSHAAGDRTLVVPCARAALAAGAHGLLVEVHQHPAVAFCDAAQSLDPEGFAELMAAI